MIQNLHLRKVLKRYLPDSVIKVVSAAYIYCQRLGRWAVIFLQIRGATFMDQMKLLASILAAPILSARNFDSWQDPQLLFDADVIVFNIGRFNLRRYTDDLWHVLPWREKSVLNAIRHILKPGDIFVDAGANIGFFSIVASKKVGMSGSVISIEMMPDTAKILRQHVKLNETPNIRIEEYALSGEQEGSVIAKVPVGSYGQASISGVDMSGDIQETEVLTRSLDDLLPEGIPINLIKMDLEGVELQVILGARKTLSHTNYLIYECWNTDDNELISSALGKLGFSISTLDRRNFLAKRGKHKES